MDEKLKDLREDSKEAVKFFTKIMAFTVGPAELKDMLENNNIGILDVRDKQDYLEGHIPNAVSIPRAELDNRYEELSKEKTYVVYCYNQQCHLGACACRFLATKDYKVVHLDGGYKVWTEDFQYAVTK